LGGGKGQWRELSARQVWWEKAPYAAVTLLVLTLGVMVRFQDAAHWGESASATDFGLLHRLMQAGYVWAYFLWKWWLPAHLTPYYTQLLGFHPASLPFVLSLAALGLISGLAFWQRARRPWLLALWIFHLAVIFPMCGWTENPHFPSDRYSLMAGMVWSALLAAGLWQLRSLPKWRAVALGLTGVLLAGCTLLSIRQTRVWNNGVVFFEYLLQRNNQTGPLTASIHYRLGMCYLDQNRLRPAEQAFRQAIALEPNLVWARARLGVALERQGRPGPAQAAFKQTLELAPGLLYAREQLAESQVRQHRLDEAVKEYRTLLEFAPKHIPAHLRLAQLLEAQGKLAEAAALRAEAEHLKDKAHAH
jgi:hypothetical protein